MNYKHIKPKTSKGPAMIKRINNMSIQKVQKHINASQMFLNITSSWHVQECSRDTLKGKFKVCNVSLHNSKEPSTSKYNGTENVRT